MPARLSSAWSRAHRAAGPLHEQIPYWGWVDGRTLLTVGGELLTLAELEPYESAGRPAEYLDHALGRWVRLLSGLGPRDRAYLYVLRRPLRAGTEGGPAPGPRAELARLALEARAEFLAPRLHELRTVAAFCRDAALSRTARDRPLLQRARDVFSRERAARRASWPRSEIERESRDFADAVDAACGLVADLTPMRILPQGEASHALSELVNAPGRSAGMRFNGHAPLSWALALSEIEAEPSHLRVDGGRAVLHSLLLPPSEARANQLAELLRLPCRTLELSWEWAPYGSDKARARLRRAQKHYWQKRYSAISQMSGGGGMLDAGAQGEADRIAAAGAELENAGVAYGDLSLGLCLRTDDRREADRTASELQRIFGQIDAKLIRETYYGTGAYFARLPGQPRKRQVRKVFVSAGSAACLAPLFGPSRGHPRSGHLQAPALAVLETRAATGYHFDLFAGGDIGHTLVLGASGSGKSFLLNFLLVSALKYDPRVAVLDLGGSYEWLTRLVGGSYLALSPEGGGTPLNPFALPPSERSWRFLSGWLEHLLRIGGYRLSGDDSSEVRKCVEDLYRRPPEHRRMGVLAGSLPLQMRPALDRWHGAGAWGPVFDSGGDALASVDDWQVVDLHGAESYPDLASAALQYCLARLSAQIDDPAERERPKILVVDEAWRFLREPQVAGYLVEAAKTWRKRNAALVLATQSGVDVDSGSRAAALLESCPTRIFLANAAMAEERYRRMFGLSASETELIRELQPKRELYLRRAEEAEALRLSVDRRSYWLFTSDPREAATRARAVEECGGDLEAALERLAGGAR